MAARALGLLLLATIMSSSGSAQEASPSSTVPRGYVRLAMPVATRDLARGDTLRAGDLVVIDTLMVWRWNGVAPDTTRAVAGWVTRRAIAAGELLRAPAVMPPPAVTSGATVSVIYQDGPLRLVLTGIATNTAPLGAPVGVRIDRTRRLDGIAVAPNTVRLR